jgi:hypothetical protein
MPINSPWPLRALRWSFCAFIVYASVQTFWAAWSGHGEPHHGRVGLLALSGVEAIAALALLVPRLAPVATWVLCAVFAIAAVLTIAAGEAPLRFAYYAATAILLGLSENRSLWPQLVSRAGA